MKSFSGCISIQYGKIFIRDIPYDSVNLIDYIIWYDVNFCTYTFKPRVFRVFRVAARCEAVWAARRTLPQDVRRSHAKPHAPPHAGMRRRMGYPCRTGGAWCARSSRLRRACRRWGCLARPAVGCMRGEGLGRLVPRRGQAIQTRLNFVSDGGARSTPRQARLDRRRHERFEASSVLDPVRKVGVVSQSTSAKAWTSFSDTRMTAGRLTTLRRVTFQRSR